MSVSKQSESESESVSVSERSSESNLESLNARILHSLEETISHSVQAVKDVVIGAEVDGFEQNTGESEGESKTLLQSMEDKIVQSVQSVEDKIVNSVQTMKDAVNATAEAAAAPASSSAAEDRALRRHNDVTVEDEAAILGLCY